MSTSSKRSQSNCSRRARSSECSRKSSGTFVPSSTTALPLKPTQSNLRQNGSINGFYDKSHSGRRRLQICLCVEEMKRQYAISKQLLHVYGDYLLSIRSCLLPMQNMKTTLGKFYEKEWNQAAVLMDAFQDAISIWSMYATELNQLKHALEKYFDLFEEVQDVLDEWVCVKDMNRRNPTWHEMMRRSVHEVEQDLLQRFKVAFASRVHLILFKYFGGFMKSLKCFGSDLSKAAEKGQEILETLPSSNPDIPLGGGFPPMSLWEVWYEAKKNCERHPPSMSSKSLLAEKVPSSREKVVAPSATKKLLRRNEEFYSRIDP